MLEFIVSAKLFCFALAAGVFATVDETWASPINTLLLILLTYAQYRIRTKITAVHEDVSSAAAAALAAAEASAHAAVASSDAARVTKEIGSRYREGELPR